MFESTSDILKQIALGEDSVLELKAVARKLRNLVAQHEFTTVGEMTISLGVASTSNYDGKENIIRRADSALYQAKGLGRNRVEQG